MLTGFNRDYVSVYKYAFHHHVCIRHVCVKNGSVSLTGGLQTLGKV